MNWLRSGRVPTAALMLLLATPVAVKAQAHAGTIRLAVDASEAPRRIIHAVEIIPVAPGPLTLRYPKWIPGEHAPSGPIADLVSVRISAAGQPLLWRREPVDMYAINLTVPTGSDSIEVVLDFVTPPPQTAGFTSGASATLELAVINWNQIVLYPDSQPSDSIICAPSIKLPAGWKFATALEQESSTGAVVAFRPVNLTSLVDSPLLTGVHFRRIDISPAAGEPHFIDLIADGEAALAMPEWQVAAYKRLVLEESAMFGARHYNHYDFLVSLSSQVANFGLEHHQCSDDRMPERAVIDSSLQRLWSSLLPHEFAHSWNGKYRRPADLGGADFQDPMSGNLLWVYEGFTTYLGEVLAARSGLASAEDFREELALLAARLSHLPGRTWRSLQDDADAAQILYGSRADWQSLRRTVDFYDESYLIWLEADVLVRTQTGGQKSLDDFCRSFFGGRNSGPALATYDRADVIVALNEIYAYEWDDFFSQRLESVAAQAPLAGIEQGGWRLVYREFAGPLQEAVENANHSIDARYSLGLELKDDGTLVDVIPESPAARAGLAPGMKLVAIDGRRFSKEIFRDMMKAATTSSEPIELLASDGDFFRSYEVDYHAGEKYPWLERDVSKPDELAEIIKPIAQR